jgi:hypothetical protein
VIQKSKNNSRLQTVLSMVILSVLLIIGAGVWITQSQFNPAVLQEDAFLAKSTQNKPSSQWSSNPHFLPLPEGIKPLTEAEIFDAGNLSDKINGKAELYFSAGFIRLVSQRFKDDGTADMWMEAFVYDMGKSQNAFSVFSTQRREGSESLDLAENAYRTSNAVFLTHGRYYVEIIASKVSEQERQPAKLMAETFTRNTPSEKAALNESTLFPEDGLVKNSVALISSNAFGFDGLDQIYTAQYEFDDQSLMAYLSRRETPAKAKEMASAYAKFLLAFGGNEIEAQLPIKGARLIEVLDTYEIVFSHGSYLAGVRDAVNADQAQNLANRLYDRLKE